MSLKPHRIGKPLGGSAFYSLAISLTISKITGFIRLIATAYALGITASADAFNLANTTPNMIHDLVVGGLVSTAIIPLFSKEYAKEKDSSIQETLSVVITYLAVLTCSATVIFELLAPWIIKAYTLGMHTSFSESETTLAIWLLRFFALQVFFYGLITIATALLNTKGVFAPVGYSGAVSNIFQILIFLELALIAKHPSVNYILNHKLLLIFLGLGTTASLAVQFLYLLPSLARLKLNFSWQLVLKHPKISEVYKIAGWNTGIVLANQVALFIVLALASIITTGAVSAFTYAYVFFQLPFGIITVSFTSTLMPRLTRFFTTNEHAKAKALLNRSIKGNLSLLLPITALYLVLGNLIVAALLYHSHLKVAQLLLAADALKMLALGLPGFGTFFILTRAMQSYFKTRQCFILYLIENITNIILAFLLYRSLGIKGICLSISLSYTLAAVIAVIYVVKVLKLLKGSDILTHFLKLIVISTIAGFSAAVGGATLPQSSLLKLLADLLIGLIVGVLSFTALSIVSTLTATSTK